MVNTAEIVGENMECVFEELGIEAQRTYHGKQGLWNNFSVWSIPSEQLTTLTNYWDNISDEDWNVKYPKSWGRFNIGAIVVKDIAKVRISGVELTAWITNTYSYCDKHEYCSLCDYFETVFGISTESNVSAMLAELAVANNMTIAELCAKCGDDYE